ncbi:MAG: hypothetical protein JKY70_01220 [Mucilaginibacter sp.]|nr:hypothetical protein [Mucilaginibacter sp.]
MKLRKEKKGLLITSLKRCITILVCVISIYFKANAQQGCLLSGTLYTAKTSGNWFGAPIYSSSPSLATTCPNGSTIQIAKLGTGPNTDCVVFFLFIPFTGSEKTYTNFTCPIDDYLPLLFVIVTLIGFYTLKTYKICT